MRTLALVAFIATVSALSGCGGTQDDTVAIREAIFESAGGRTLYIREHVTDIEKELVSTDERRLYSGFEFESHSDSSRASDFGHLAIHLIPDSEYKSMFDGGCERGWRRFHARYPEALELFELSAVGFRARHSEAFVYIASGSGCVAARGDLIFLQKRAGKWRVIKGVNLWVS